jgi:RNA polymerase sigma-70 factor (ECF subfamily)
MMLGFMKVFRKLETFEYRDESSLFIWIRKIMINEALMFIRQKQNLMFVVEEVPDEISIQPEIINAIDAEDLYSHIIKLPPGYRTIFNLNVIEGYDHKEIASMLSISEATSRSQLAKAKSKLRNSITQNSQQYGKVRR